MRKINLDKEEEEIFESIESGKWKPVKNSAQLMQTYAAYAKNTLKKDQRVSIRISRQDFLGIQARAIDEGLPYQTLITSIIHKYINGKLAGRG
jgi:predicted DNA binding CopG/RHH family protein